MHFYRLFFRYLPFLLVFSALPLACFGQSLLTADYKFNPDTGQLELVPLEPRFELPDFDVEPTESEEKPHQDNLIRYVCINWDELLEDTGDLDSFSPEYFQPKPEESSFIEFSGSEITFGDAVTVGLDLDFGTGQSECYLLFDGAFWN